MSSMRQNSGLSINNGLRNRMKLVGSPIILLVVLSSIWFLGDFSFSKNNELLRLEVEMKSLSRIKSCDEDNHFAIRCVNNTDLTLTESAIVVRFPPWLTYQEGSLQGKTGDFLAVNSKTPDSLIIFLRDLSPNESISLSIKSNPIPVITEVPEEKLGGKIIFYSKQGYSGRAYKLELPQLPKLMLSMKKGQAEVFTGDTLYQKLEISNVGRGKFFKLFLNRNLGKGLKAHKHFSYPVQDSLNLIEIPGELLRSIGNQDDYLDPGETITYVDELVVNTCMDRSSSIQYQAVGGCENSFRTHTWESQEIQLSYNPPTIDLGSFACNLLQVEDKLLHQHSVKLIPQKEQITSMISIDIEEKNSVGVQGFFLTNKDNNNEDIPDINIKKSGSSLTLYLDRAHLLHPRLLAWELASHGHEKCTRRYKPSIKLNYFDACGINGYEKEL